MTKALEGGEGSALRPGRSLPPGKDPVPLYRRLGGPQGRSRQVRKISPPPGFDPRTVQPVASRYTDWATRPTSFIKGERVYWEAELVNSAKEISGPWSYFEETDIESYLKPPILIAQAVMLLLMTRKGTLLNTSNSYCVKYQAC